MSSLALIASYRRRLALGLTCHTGLSLLFEVGVRPPHDGIRRMGRPNQQGMCLVDELGELRFDPEGQHCRFDSTTSTE
jgi:hypothetical protein